MERTIRLPRTGIPIDHIIVNAASARTLEEAMAILRDMNRRHREYRQALAADREKSS